MNIVLLVLTFSVVAGGRFLAYTEKTRFVHIFASPRLCVKSEERKDAKNEKPLLSESFKNPQK